MCFEKNHTNWGATTIFMNDDNEATWTCEKSMAMKPQGWVHELRGDLKCRFAEVESLRKDRM